MQFPRKLLAYILQQNEGSQLRKKMAQDLRNKESTQERGEGNSQSNDEEKCQDFHQTVARRTTSQLGAGGQISRKYRTYRLPDMFECIARCLDMFVG